MSRLVSHLIFINIEMCNKNGAFMFYYKNGINVKVDFAGIIGPHIYSE